MEEDVRMRSFEMDSTNCRLLAPFDSITNFTTSKLRFHITMVRLRSKRDYGNEDGDAVVP